MTEDTQTTLDGFDSDDSDADEIEDVRRDLDRLTAIVDTLAESHQDLADAVDEVVHTGSRDATTERGADVPESGRGFQ